MSGSWFYFNKGVIRELGLSGADVEKTLANWLGAQPGVEAAFTRSQVQGKPKLADPLAESVRLSFFFRYQRRSSRSCSNRITLFTVDFKKSPGSATTHGSPYDYDTHVPLLAYGPGIRPGKHAERITPQALTTILARGLDLPLPSAAEAPLPKGVFDKE